MRVGDCNVCGGSEEMLNGLIWVGGWIAGSCYVDGIWRFFPAGIFVYV